MTNISGFHHFSIALTIFLSPPNICAFSHVALILQFYCTLSKLSFIFCSMKIDRIVLELWLFSPFGGIALVCSHSILIISLNFLQSKFKPSLNIIFSINNYIYSIKIIKTSPLRFWQHLLRKKKKIESRNILLHY